MLVQLASLIICAVSLFQHESCRGGGFAHHGHIVALGYILNKRNLPERVLKFIGVVQNLMVSYDFCMSLGNARWLSLSLF